MPDRETLLTLIAPDVSLPDLLRIAIDAARLGVCRIHLADPAHHEPGTAEELVRQSGLLVTGKGLQPVRPGFIDAVVPDGNDLPGITMLVAELAGAAEAGVSVLGAGSAEIPTLLAGLAAGAHLAVAAVPAGTADPVRMQLAAVARAAGLARLAGRPPMTPESARSVLFAL